MHSEWRVSSQYIGSDKVFQVYRIRDISKVNHSGNREYAGGLFYYEDEATTMADTLNVEKEREEF